MVFLPCSKPLNFLEIFLYISAILSRTGSRSVGGKRSHQHKANVFTKAWPTNGCVLDPTMLKRKEKRRGKKHEKRKEKKN